MAGCQRAEDRPPLIFAAASLADVLADAVDAYENESGKRVEFNFGGSNALANLVSRFDAPADGVVLAGQVPMETLVDAEKVDAAGVRTIARNSLLVVSENGLPIQSLSDLARAGSRIAIADPELAPAGQYAEQALRSAGIWDAVRGRIVPTLDVRAALAAAGSGSVDYAIVYATDATAEPGLTVVLTVEPGLHEPVIYPAAAIKGTAAADRVSEFLEFLISPSGRAIFQQHGFMAPG